MSLPAFQLQLDNSPASSFSFPITSTIDSSHAIDLTVTVTVSPTPTSPAPEASHTVSPNSLSPELSPPSPTFIPAKLPPARSSSLRSHSSSGSQRDRDRDRARNRSPRSVSAFTSRNASPFRRPITPTFHQTTTLDALATVHTYFEKLVALPGGRVNLLPEGDERIVTATLLGIHRVLRDLCPSLLETDAYAEALIDSASGGLGLHIFAGFVAPLLVWNCVQGIEGRAIVSLLAGGADDRARGIGLCCSSETSCWDSGSDFAIICTMTWYLHYSWLEFSKQL